MRLYVLVASEIAALATSIPASAHMTTELRKNFVPPPLKAEMQEARELAKTLADDAPVARGVIDTFKLWPLDHKLTACFFDGDDRWREFFVEISKVWSSGTSLVIDFGSAPGFSTCDKQKPRDIRISFARPGAWSYVGTDSLRYESRRRLPQCRLSTGKKLGRDG